MVEGVVACGCADHVRALLAKPSEEDRSIVTLNDTGATHEDLEASVKLITALIDFNNDKILECPAVVRRAFQALDTANYMQRSQGETKRESLIWASHESDKMRQLYQYFRRLCARSAWSHSKVVCILKLRYHARKISILVGSQVSEGAGSLRPSDGEQLATVESHKPGRSDSLCPSDDEPSAIAPTEAEEDEEEKDEDDDVDDDPLSLEEHEEQAEEYLDAQPLDDSLREAPIKKARTVMPDVIAIESEEEREPPIKQNADRHAGGCCWRQSSDATFCCCCIVRVDRSNPYCQPQASPQKTLEQAQMKSTPKQIRR